ncbi:MAG: hypothetical protein WKG07_32710 [Hymenobacter sp.]
MGWQVGATMPEELVTTRLAARFLAQPPTPGLLVHSDRGGQYCGNAYRQLLARPRGRALAEPPRRLLRQCASRKPVVAPQNGGARTPRAARFCRPGRRASQRRRLF